MNEEAVNKKKEGSLSPNRARKGQGWEKGRSNRLAYFFFFFNLNHSILINGGDRGLQSCNSPWNYSKCGSFFLYFCISVLSLLKLNAHLVEMQPHNT